MAFTASPTNTSKYIISVLLQLASNCAQGKLIVAHLGNGASMCVIERCPSIAATMFFTPVDGLMMGTRVGALDPGVILYLLQHEEMNAAAIKTLIYERSGLLGVSGLSSDMRTLLAGERPALKEAINLLVYRIRRELGSLAGALGGLDALVFTGGIGEHAVEIRARCAATRNGSGSGSMKWPMPPAGRVSQGSAQRFQCGSCRPMRT